MNQANLNATQETLDVVKQLKVNGKFDQLRKDCFAKITSQPEYQTLTKQVEHYVLEFLRKQKPNSKKSIVRENLRRNLNESFFLSEGISKLIEAQLDPEELNLKSLINNMVTEQNKPISPSDTTAVNKQIAPAANVTNLVREPNATTESLIQESNPLKTSIQKVSIEDFIPSTEKPKVSTKTTAPVPSQANPNKLKHSKSIEKPLASKDKNEKLQAKKTSNLQDSEIKQASKHKSTTVTSNKTDNKKTEHFESVLDLDPTNEYKFDWHLNYSMDTADYDTFSISSVNSSDLSDFEEMNSF